MNNWRWACANVEHRHNYTPLTRFPSEMREEEKQRQRTATEWTGEYQEINSSPKICKILASKNLRCIQFPDYVHSIPPVFYSIVCSRRILVSSCSTAVARRFATFYVASTLLTLLTITKSFPIFPSFASFLLQFYLKANYKQLSVLFIFLLLSFSLCECICVCVCSSECDCARDCMSIVICDNFIGVGVWLLLQPL